jgi:hypothetical protein
MTASPPLSHFLSLMDQAMDWLAPFGENPSSYLAYFEHNPAYDDEDFVFGERTSRDAASGHEHTHDIAGQTATCNAWLTFAQSFLSLPHLDSTQSLSLCLYGSPRDPTCQISYQDTVLFASSRIKSIPLEDLVRSLAAFCIHSKTLAAHPLDGSWLDWIVDDGFHVRARRHAEADLIGTLLLDPLQQHPKTHSVRLRDPKQHPQDRLDLQTLLQVL